VEPQRATARTHVGEAARDEISPACLHACRDDDVLEEILEHDHGRGDVQQQAEGDGRVEVDAEDAGGAVHEEEDAVAVLAMVQH
jgi:hypothetical protein